MMITSILLTAWRNTLFAVVLIWMNSLVPNQDHSTLAWAIAVNAETYEEASVFTAVAFRESTFKLDAVGDHGSSVCAMQIHNGSKDLLTDAVACVAKGAEMLRESRRMDRKFPIAFYAEGPNFTSDRAKRISRDRMAIARRLMVMKP